MKRMFSPRLTREIAVKSPECSKCGANGRGLTSITTFPSVCPSTLWNVKAKDMVTGCVCMLTTLASIRCDSRTLTGVGKSETLTGIRMGSSSSNITVEKFSFRVWYRNDDVLWWVLKQDVASRLAIDDLLLDVVCVFLVVEDDAFVTDGCAVGKFPRRTDVVCQVGVTDGNAGKFRIVSVQIFRHLLGVD